MKKKLYIVLTIILASGLIFLALWQVNKFFERKAEEAARQEPTGNFPADEYERLLESLAPNPNATSTLSEEEYEALSASLAPAATATTTFEDGAYEDMIESLKPKL